MLFISRLLHVVLGMSCERNRRSAGLCLFSSVPLPLGRFLQTLRPRVKMWIVPLRGKYLVWAITGSLNLSCWFDIANTH